MEDRPTHRCRNPRGAAAGHASVDAAASPAAGVGRRRCAAN